jgi:hypothetical protein
MSTTRTGKIARLPQHIRVQLNRQLEDSEPGKQLVEWLNNLPEVKAVLQGQFGGRPISEQNLSEWRQGGYQDWLRHQETCELVGRLTEEAGDLEGVTDEVAVSDCLAPMLAAELARTVKVLLEEDTEPQERWRRLQEVLKELGEMRRDDHRAARLRRDQEVWQREDAQLAKEEHQRTIRKFKDEATAPIWAALQVPIYAETFGGGEPGRQLAAWMLELEHDLPAGTLTAKPPAAPAQPTPNQPDLTESNPIKPDQTECGR